MQEKMPSCLTVFLLTRCLKAGMYKKLVLKKGKEKSLLNFHPWVFSGAVASHISEIADGEIVEIFSTDKKYIATAHFNNGSIIARIISFEQKEINYDFW